MIWDELLRWMESPTRRLLLLVYLMMAGTVLWILARIAILFLYHRVVLTFLSSDLDYAYQFTTFLGRGRNWGYAVFRTRAQLRVKWIVFGRTVIDLKLPTRKGDPRKLRARLLLLLREGSPVSVQSALLMRRAGKRVDLDKLLFRMAVGFGDPAVTGMASAIFYPITAELPKEPDRFGMIVPLWDREGLDLEVELAAGFRPIRVLVPFLRYVLHPQVIRFSWRWMRPRIKPAEQQPALPNEKKSSEVSDHGRQVLRNRIPA